MSKVETEETMPVVNDAAELYYTSATDRLDNQYKKEARSDNRASMEQMLQTLKKLLVVQMDRAAYNMRVYADRITIKIEDIGGKIKRTYNTRGQVFLAVVSGVGGIAGGFSSLTGAGLKFAGKMPLAQLFNGMGQGIDAVGKAGGSFGSILENKNGSKRNWLQLQMDIAKRKQQDRDQAYGQAVSKEDQLINMAQKAEDARHASMKQMTTAAAA